MAYPGTYNFSYYRGDTLEFNVFPKNNDGSAFSLTGYDVTFSIATSRGIDATVEPLAYVSPDNSFITCVITPADGLQLQPGTPYVYDIEMRNLQAQPYQKVYTILTGDITVQEQVTNIPLEVIQVPNAVTNLTIVENPEDTVNVGWLAPTEGDLPTSYNIYAKSAGLGIAEYVLVTNTTDTAYSTTSVATFPISGIPSGAVIDIKVTSVNSAGENTTSFAEGSVTLA
jgi:hypothetical protein